MMIIFSWWNWRLPVLVYGNAGRGCACVCVEPILESFGMRCQLPLASVGIPWFRTFCWGSDGLCFVPGFMDAEPRPNMENHHEWSKWIPHMNLYDHYIPKCRQGSPRTSESSCTGSPKGAGEQWALGRWVLDPRHWFFPLMARHVWPYKMEDTTALLNCKWCSDKFWCYDMCKRTEIWHLSRGHGLFWLFPSVHRMVYSLNAEVVCWQR